MAYGPGDSAHDDQAAEFRQEYSEDTTGWKPIRDEGQIDIRYAAGDPWEPSERQWRETAKRLCLTFDELGQNLNQVNNDVRQNKRSIKVTAQGNGAEDKEAQLRANAIRQIEYRSNAQQAYSVMFENAVQRSYGWTRIISRYANKSKSHQELLIQAVPNPDLITPGPHVMPDGSDLERVWYHEWWSHDEFKRKFGGKTGRAKVQDFSSREWHDLAPGWVDSKKVMVAERWGRETRPNGHEYVCQYFTNGLEILKKTEWPGQYIPFVPCYGKVMFVQDGGKTDMRILSLIRHARDPFRSYCYVMTCIAELIGQMPKFPYMVHEGALSDTMLQALARSVSEPVAVIEVKPTLDGLSTLGLTPFPQRNPYDPTALPGLMAAAEVFRRSIQAAIGATPLPTSAQRRNEKSGVALKQIEDSGQRGSYHFYDHFEGSLMRVGVILNDLLGPIHDTARDLAIRKPDDTTQIVRVNDPQWKNPETGQHEQLGFTEGDYDVTISTGPKVDSEREAASDFADLIMGNVQILAPIIGQQNMAEIVALAIKVKNVGALGDQMAEIISPSQDDQKQDPRMLQQQLGQMQQVLDATTKELEQRVKQIETDQVKQQGQLELQKSKNDVAILLQQMKDATAIRIAEMKDYAAAEAHAADHEQQALGHAVDISESEASRQHEAEMAQLQQQNALQQGEQGHQQALQQGQQGHEQAMEQGAAGHEQNLEAAAQQAALAPEPVAGE